ncbi:MAG: ParB/RepB/Spo0J family partition protein [Candidatus Caldarchaeum sp.]|nr:ParB/RepB/Spo0J family partition protein [Candidatus Caldarchaeum sp.]
MRSSRSRIRKIDVQKVRLIEWLPNRRDMGEIVELARSIKKRGDVDVPIKVRPAPNGFYELIWGRRRLEATLLAGLQKISAIVEELNDEEILIQNSLENMFRKDKNPIEEAELFETWKKKFGRTYEEIAKEIGVRKEYVYNRVQLLSLSPKIIKTIQSGSIDTNRFGLLHARVLLKVRDYSLQERLFREVIEESLTVRELRRRVNAITSGEKRQPAFIDLSQPIFNGMPHIPKIMTPPQIRPATTVQVDSVNITNIAMPCHIGTHVETPRQFFEDGKTIEEYDLSRFMGECVVVEVSKGPNQAISLDDIREYEDQIEPNTIVFFKTGWGRIFRQPEYNSHPYITEEVALRLCDLKIGMVGVDTLTPEMPFHMRRNGFDYPIHKILLSHDVLIIENLNLTKLEGCRKVRITAFPIPISGCEAAPCRVVAWVDDKIISAEKHREKSLKAITKVPILLK